MAGKTEIPEVGGTDISAGLIDRVNGVFNNRRAREMLLNLRIPILLLLFIFLLTRLDKEWFTAGLVISGLGELLQLWCFATIQTKKQLTASGPYMFVRNPMYIGRFFLILGIVMMTGNPWFIMVYVVFYYFYMINRVNREEKLLQEIFGDPYLQYCRKVNRYIPSAGGLDARKLLAVNRESFRQNHGLRNLLLVSAAYMILYISAYY